MSIQAWTGDFVNVFLTGTYSTSVNASVGGSFLGAYAMYFLVLYYSK
jgi:hypothetical protein